MFNFRRPSHLVQDDNEEFANVECGAQSRFAKKTKKTKLAMPPIPPPLYKDVTSTNDVHNDWSNGAEVNLQQSSTPYQQASHSPLTAKPDEHTIEMQCEPKSSDNDKFSVDSHSASSEHDDNDNETMYQDTSTNQSADEASSAIDEQLLSSANASKTVSQRGTSEAGNPLARLCKDSNVKLPVHQTASGLTRKADSEVCRPVLVGRSSIYVKSARKSQFVKSTVPPQTNLTGSAERSRTNSGTSQNFVKHTSQNVKSQSAKSVVPRTESTGSDASRTVHGRMSQSLTSVRSRVDGSQTPSAVGGRGFESCRTPSGVSGRSTSLSGHCGRSSRADGSQSQIPSPVGGTGITPSGASGRSTQSVRSAEVSERRQPLLTKSSGSNINGNNGKLQLIVILCVIL